MTRTQSSCFKGIWYPCKKKSGHSSLLIFRIFSWYHRKHLGVFPNTNMEKGELDPNGRTRLFFRISPNKITDM